MIEGNSRAISISLHQKWKTFVGRKCQACMLWGNQACKGGWETYAELRALAYLLFSIGACACSLEWGGGPLFWCTATPER